MDVRVMDIRWMGQGACLGAPSLPWTADTWRIPEGVRDVVVGRMVDVCAACPVLDRCAVMATTMTGGFWAGRDRASHPKSRGRGVVGFVQPSLGFELGGVV